MNALTALVLVAILGFAAPIDAVAQTSHTKKKKPKHPVAGPCRAGCKPETSSSSFEPATPEDAAAQRELSDLAHALHFATPGAYERLSAFSARHAGTVWGARASLSLGYDDYAKNRIANASPLLAAAQKDPLLREYALYWSAQTDRILKRPEAAYNQFEIIAKDYPNSAMREQFLEAFAPTAGELGHSAEAIEALNAYSSTATRPPLLLERAQAYKAGRQLAKAAKDYQTLYYKYPLSDEAKAAGNSLTEISRALGKEYAYPGAAMQAQRAQLFYDAHKWKEARAEYEKLGTMLRDSANPMRQLALLRVAQCRIQPKGSPAGLASLTFSDPEVDAERLFSTSQAYRSAKDVTKMLGATDTIAQKYPQSKWTEEALMQAGNYYWVQLDRTQAAQYYQRVLSGFPAGKNAYNVEWRTAWVAYLNRQPAAADRLATFLKKYPVSANAVDALYWLGRDAERGGNFAHARAFFNKAVERFPQTYFAHAAALRLAKLGPGDSEDIEYLAQIPAAPALRAFDEPVPAAAADRWARAEALRTIAFDASAELELKAAYFATSSPRFLIEAAQAAFDQGHFAVGMAYGRIAVPSFESRKISDLPVGVWKTLYPLPYEAALRREAARNDFDPMFAAGLIRQESTFQADIVSHANAVGLMQVLPKTGKILAKQLKVKYNKNLLFQPDYNLQLGMVYIANLVRLTGAPEYAAAAYNAGEDRIAAWKAERNYEEIPELVESIPFTETREYVQIVSRNAAVYRAVYGNSTPNASIAAANNSR